MKACPQHSTGKEGVTISLSMVALINARVEGEPEEIYALVEEAVMLTASRTGTQVNIREHNAFSPGMPSPVHRILQD